MVIFSHIYSWTWQEGKRKNRKEKQLSHYPLVICTHTQPRLIKILFSTQRKRCKVRERQRVGQRDYLSWFVKAVVVQWEVKYQLKMFPGSISSILVTSQSQKDRHKSQSHLHTHLLPRRHYEAQRHSCERTHIRFLEIFTGGKRYFMYNKETGVKLCHIFAAKNLNVPEFDAERPLTSSQRRMLNLRRTM